jgi:acetyl esterase/lipase
MAPDRPTPTAPAIVPRRALTGQVLAGLGLMLLGGFGLAGMRIATARGSVAMLDATDRLLAGGDGAIRLAMATAYGDDPAQRLELFLPTDPVFDPAVSGRALPVVMFIHGGGWVSGDPHDYRFIARALAPAGHAVVLAGYRLDSAGRYPAMLEDGAAVLRWIADHAQALGCDATRIVLMGHSAGAYNAVMLGLDPRWLAASGLAPQAICGVIGLAGPYDFLPFDNVSTIATFGHAPDPAQTQPIAHVRGDAPPLLLIHGAQDRRVYPRNSLSLARAMAGCGGSSETHVIDGIGHEGLIMRFARPFSRDRRPLDQVFDFLARVTRIPASARVQANGL